MIKGKSKGGGSDADVSGGDGSFCWSHLTFAITREFDGLLLVWKRRTKYTCISFGLWIMTVGSNFLSKLTPCSMSQSQSHFHYDPHHNHRHSALMCSQLQKRKKSNPTTTRRWQPLPPPTPMSRRVYKWIKLDMYFNTNSQRLLTIINQPQILYPLNNIWLQLVWRCPNW